MLILAAALFLSGCATGADVAGLATQDEVLRLRSDVTALQRSAQQARAQTEALSRQFTAHSQPQPSETQRHTEAINQRLDTMTATLTTLGKRLDDLTARVDALGRQVRASALRPGGGPPPHPPSPPSVASPTGPRTAAPVPPPTAGPASPHPPTAAPVAPPATAAPATPTPGPARPATAALQPQDLYQASYIDFSKGGYALAIDGFRDFLRRYPDHPQAHNAQYWIGEGYAALAQQYTNAGQADRAAEALQRAVQEFRKVVANYPRSDRAPTALYKEALALMELKQPALAQARLQYLVDNFPQAEETPLARERLAALRK